MDLAAKDQERQRKKLEPTDDQFVLRLYVTGATTISARAIENIRGICEEYLRDHYALNVIDIRQSPMLAEEGQIFAAPTLIKEAPLPVRRLVGDLSDRSRVLKSLNIKSKP